jgi:Family of unknown function (DUF5947)
MSALGANAGASPLATLRRLARVRTRQERCDLCSVPLTPAHRHLLEMAQGRIVCACDPCALRFQSVVDGKFRLIPRDARVLEDFRISDAQWESLALPINLAFFFHHSTRGKMVAMYPSPAGATESLLPLDSWNALLAENPGLRGMEADVEALLANRLDRERQYFIAPIDRCYELVGLIRMHWRGLSGGETVWRAIAGYFADLRAQRGAPAEQEVCRA